MTRSEALYQIVPKIASTLFIVLFVYAATSKLLDSNEFKIQLDKSPFISIYADWLAWGIPLIELTIAGLFLFPKYLLPAFYFSFSLITLFTTYIFLVLNYSDSIPCSCGGVLAKLGWKEHLVFNIAFMALALIGIRLSNKRKNYLAKKNTA